MEIILIESKRNLNSSKVMILSDLQPNTTEMINLIYIELNTLITSVEMTQKIQASS